MRGSKVVAACIFNELQADCQPVSSFGWRQHTYRSLYQWKKVPKLVNNAVFIHTKSLFFVSAVAMSAFQLLEHTYVAVAMQRMYALGAIEYSLSNMGKY